MKKKIYILILLTMLMLASCSSDTSDKVVEISPSTLLEGDLKNLESHLDLITGCIDVSYIGNKKKFSVYYEQWKNGKVIEEYGGIEFKDQGESFKKNISISFKNIEKNKYRIKSAVEGAAWTQEIELPGNLTYYPVNLDNEIERGDEEDIIIWALVGTEDNSLIYYEDIENTLEEIDLAIVFKIKFK